MFKRLTLLLIGLVLYTMFTFCSSTIPNDGDSITPSAPTTNYFRDRKFPQKRYYVRYYKYPKYHYKSKKYKFRKKYQLTQDNLKTRSAYFRVYFSKKTRRVARIDRIKFNKLAKVTEFYTKNGQLSRSNTYFGKRLDNRGLYKKNRLLSKVKYSAHNKRKQIIHRAKIRFVKDGREEKWYNLRGEIVYQIYYNQINEPSEYAFYKKGRLDNLVKYFYDKEGQIIREEYFTNKGRLFAYKVFIYDNKGNITLANRFVKRRLTDTTEYDAHGREIAEKQYNNDGLIASTAKITYKPDGKIIRRHNNFNQLISISKYNKHEQLVSHLKYNNDIVIYSEEYDYREGVLRKAQYHTNGKISNLIIYNDRGLQSKNEKYKEGSLLTYSTFSYDKKGNMNRARQYSRSGTLISTWKYYYNKKGKVVKEESHQNSKLISKIQYTYHQDNTLRSKKTFQKRDFYRKTQDGNISITKDYLIEEFFDARGRVFKKATSINGKLEQAIVYRYDKNGKIVREELYDRVGELVRYVKVKYDIKGQRIREDGYNRNDNYEGTIFYFYDQRGNRVKEERYNWLKQLYQKLIYGANGKVLKVINIRAD